MPELTRDRVNQVLVSCRVTELAGLRLAPGRGADQLTIGGDVAVRAREDDLEIAGRVALLQVLARPDRDDRRGPIPRRHQETP